MTMPPRDAIKKANWSLLPHCAGDTQTSPLSAIIATMPKLVGLKMCLPFPAKEKFARNRQRGGDDQHRRAVGAQEQAKRKAGNEGAARIEGRCRKKLCAQELG
jgi:hypothetical protein